MHRIEWIKRSPASAKIDGRVSKTAETKACERKQRKQKAAKFKVMLDAGHGGYDAGSESKEGKKRKISPYPLP